MWGCRNNHVCRGRGWTMSCPCRSNGKMVICCRQSARGWVWSLTGKQRKNIRCRNRDELSCIARMALLPTGSAGVQSGSYSEHDLNLLRGQNVLDLLEFFRRKGQIVERTDIIFDLTGAAGSNQG